MRLVYLDESGNSGNNLSDPQQPVFLLCAMIVEEKAWQELELDLAGAVDQYFPPPREPTFEIHGTELRTARGYLRNLPVQDRVRFRDEWMDIAARHGIKLIYRAIEKRRYQKWLIDTFGSGVFINPHVAAFALLSQVVNSHLGDSLGIFISDENKEISADLEKSIRVLRGTTGTLQLNRIIEKGFFIDSSKSLPLQLCDVFALSLRKMEERKLGHLSKSVDDSGIERAAKLVYRGQEAWKDVMAWLTDQEAQRNKEAARENSGVGEDRPATGR